MTAIIHRNAWFLKNVPSDVAYYVCDVPAGERRAVTWAEIHRDRTARQEARLSDKRERGVMRRRVVRISVRFFDIIFYGGWHTYIDGVGGTSVWVRSDSLVKVLMQRFPLMLPLGRAPYHWRSDAYHMWMERFAQRYRKGRHDGKPRGCVYAWAMVEGFGGWARVDSIEPMRREERRKEKRGKRRTTS